MFHVKQLDILYHGEIQILGWGESRNRGKFLTIRLWDGDNDPLEPFRGLDINDKKSLHILNATISQGDITDIVEEDYGKLATHLYRNGFFYAPPVLAAIGTDVQYRNWLQHQASALSGKYSEYINGQGKCEAAHVRRADNSGTGFKPEYSCIPLTHEEHMLQHSQGEKALQSREWFEKKRNEYLVKWAKHTLLKQLGDYEGFKEVQPEILYDWCQEHQLLNYLPKEYKDRVNQDAMQGLAEQAQELGLGYESNE